MLKIRLARVGKRKKPTFRFIVSEQSRDTFGKALEILGHYNPFSKVCEVNKERILYWLSQGAKASPTAHNLLVDQNVISGAKVKASKAGKKNETQVRAETQAPAAGQAENKSEEKPAETAVKENKSEEKKSEPALEPEIKEAQKPEVTK
ncbi:MAG TPA: 30S ribosomal protein S16 [Patescibacteria group bacterium]|nr:30S ribosomal protein S16 [Patescibacteria group bacterium]